MKAAALQPAAPAKESAEPAQEARGHEGRFDAPQRKRSRFSLSQPNDACEREADALAEKVMRKAEGDSEPEEASRCSSCGVARKVDDGREGEGGGAGGGVPDTLENSREMEESNVSPKRDSGGGASASAEAALGSAIGARAAGQSLDGGTRAFMEGRFGHDFSRVRVHTDERANTAARAIGASAFTVGQDIWFARGRFAPQTNAGRRLLAHELAHTLQQARDGSRQLVRRSTCPSACTGPVGRGELCRASEVTRDNCAERDEADSSNRISHIRVLLDTRELHLFWNGTPRTDDGRKEVHTGITPNPDRTPEGWDTVGVKCGENHTSYKRYNMAWFTAFKSTGMVIGFHDSQPLGAGRVSAGCVRTSCELARTINRDTKSDWTSIMVRNSRPGD